MKKREANFELLRILAMLMIITLHYLDKGGALMKASASLTFNGYLAWGLEALCVVSVNVYVLISAYFLADGSWRLSKVVRLWLEVFFYSALIGLLYVSVYGLTEGMGGWYQCLTWLFPIVEEHYWFATSYIFMYCLAPFMNEGLKKLSAKAWRQLIAVLVFFLSVSKTVLPVLLPTDGQGYDVLWFLCLYVIGVYLRVHGLPVLEAKGRAAACYLGSCGLIFLSLLAVRFVFLKSGSLEGFITRQYQYNSLLCLTGAVSLFWAFRAIRLPAGKLSDGIIRAASASFGVYLLHEHMYLRYAWPAWLGAGKACGTPYFLLHWLLSVLCVYGCGMAVDFGRQWLFARVGRNSRR